MIKNKCQSETKRKRELITTITMLLITLILIFLLIHSCNNDTNLIPSNEPIFLEDEGFSAEGEAEVRTSDEILNDLKQQQLIVTDKLSSNITFPSSEAGAIGQWITENPEENGIIVQAEVYLNDVLIAKSTPIYPNQHITGIALGEDIESGEYEVVAYLNYYDIETKEFVSKAGYRVHMTVR